MASSRITSYNPLLTAAENAKINGVSERAIYHYIRTNGIDSMATRKLHIYNIVHDYVSAHPGAKIAQVGKAVGLPDTTVRRYLNMPKPEPKPNKTAELNDASKMTFVSVSDSQTKILKSILSFHLQGDATFQCDVTAWTCGFYKEIPRPKNLFDKYPQLECVRPLEDIVREGLSGFKSVVVDLPVGVYKPGSSKEPNVATVFASMEELYAQNREMLQLTHRMLRTGGILVFKTMDFAFQGQTQWISDFIIRTASELGFALIDKYIYLDPKHKLDGRRTRFTASVPNHAYFLVFRK